MLCCGILSICGCTNVEKSEGTEGIVQKEGQQVENEPVMEIDEETVGLKATEVQSGTGEGTSSMELDDLSESTEYQIGDTIKIENGTSSYTLKIDSVSYTDQRNTHVRDIENVVLIDYTYENLSDEILLVGDVRFQLTDSVQEKVYESYYYNDLKTAEPVEKGQSVSAQVAFAQDDTESEVFLVYTDIVDEHSIPVLIRIADIGNGQ